MGNWLGKIVNTAKQEVSLVGKALGSAGKDINVVVKAFIRIEPAAVTAIAPFFPAAVPIISAAYAIAEHIEADLTAPGATKGQMAAGILTDAVIPTVTASLAVAGSTIDQAKVAALVPDLFAAIVAENYAQAAVSTILSDAKATGTIPDPAKLAAAESAIAAAVAQVKSFGAAIQAAVSSVQPA